MIFGNTEHHEIFGVIPVRFAEFPESTADCIETGSCHIDRTEATVSGKIGGAKLGCPPAGQALALVPACEKGQLARVTGAHVAQPLCRQFKRFIPFNFLKLTAAALATLFKGFFSRAGDRCCMMPALPLAQSTPLLVG